MEVAALELLDQTPLTLVLVLVLAHFQFLLHLSLEAWVHKIQDHWGPFAVEKH
jgi:hypothetical protein